MATTTTETMATPAHPQPQVQFDNSTPTEPASLRTKLAAGEPHWAWKVALRSAIIVLVVIGLIVGAYLLSTDTNLLADAFYGYYDDGWAIEPAIAFCAISLIWCAVYLLVLFLRRPQRPPHPGIAVGIDLVLVIALILTGLVSLVVYFDTTYFGADGTIGDPGYNSSYSGEYRYNASTHTWVYHITYVDPYSNPAGATVNNVRRHCKPEFTSCKAQDAYVNALWRRKSTREALALVLVTMQLVAALLHFVLFVWACVDTHRRRRSQKERRNTLVVDEVLRQLQAKGAITVHDPRLIGAGGAMQAPGQGAAVPTQGRQQMVELPPQLHVAGIPSPTTTPGVERDPDVIEKASGPARYA